MSQPTSSLTRDCAFLPRACAVANEEDGPIDIWSCEERDRHISCTLTRPETTVAPGWEHVGKILAEFQSELNFIKF